MRNLVWVLFAIGCGSSGKHAPDAAPAAITFTTPNALDGLLVAMQDGDGAWTTLTPSAPGMYSFQVASDRYGIMFTCPNISSLVLIDELAVADATQVTDAISCAAALASLSGTVTGNGSANVLVNWNTDQTTIDSGGNYSVSAPSGPHDVIAAAFTATNGAAAYQSAVIQRGVQPGSANAIDFTSPIALEPHTVSLIGATELNVTVYASISTANGTGATTSVHGPNAVTYVPQSALQTGDRITTQTQGFGKTSNLLVAHFSLATEVGDTTVDLSATAPLATVTVAQQTPLVLQAAWPAQPQASVYTFNVYTLTAGDQEWLVQASSGYAEQAGNVLLALPDLSTVAGFPPSAALPPGEVGWTMYATTGSFQPTFAFGLGEFSTIGSTGTLTP